MPVTTRHGGRRVILIVDDQRLVLQSLQRILESQGLETMGVTSGWGALEVIQSDTSIDAMLVDVVLEDVAGDEVIRRAKRVRPSLPIIAMSGYGDHFEGLADLPFADGYLAKPFEAAQLVEMIERLTDPDSTASARGTRIQDAPLDSPAGRSGLGAEGADPDDAP